MELFFFWVQNYFICKQYIWYLNYAVFISDKQQLLKERKNLHIASWSLQSVLCIFNKKQNNKRTKQMISLRRFHFSYTHHTKHQVHSALVCFCIKQTRYNGFWINFKILIFSLIVSVAEKLLKLPDHGKANICS